jgi:hypothetical protein
MTLLIHAKYNPTLYLPYIQALPTTSQTQTPLNLLHHHPETFQKLLTGTLIESLVLTESNTLEQLHDTLYLPFIHSIHSTHATILNPPNETTESLMDDLRWAHTMIESRAFKLCLDPPMSSSSPANNDNDTADNQQDPHLSTVLIPIIDLCNHSQNPNLELRGITNSQTTSPYLTVITTRDIHPHEELTISYRPTAPNWVLLTHYGFAEWENPREKVQVEISPPEAPSPSPEDPTAEAEQDSSQLELRKQLLLYTSDLEGLGVDHELGPVGAPQAGIPDALLGSLRILLGNSKDLLDLTISNLSGRIFKPLNEENERRVWETILLMSLMLQQNYGTSLEEDLEELEGMKRRKDGSHIEEAGENEEGEGGYYVLVYLIGQKRILKEVEGWSRAQLEKLE